MRERSRARKSLRHKRAKASFWIGGFPGGYERFELRGRILRYGHGWGKGSRGLPRQLLRPKAVEQLWRDIETTGCWRWTEPRVDDRIVDGVQWELRLRYGARLLELRGDNAFPPEGTIGMSPGFARLVGAFRAAAHLPTLAGEASRPSRSR